MSTQRYRLIIKRHEGKQLTTPKEVSSVVLETRQRSLFSWDPQNEIAARPLNDPTVVFKKDGIHISGLERQGRMFHFQEWQLIPMSGNAIESNGEGLEPLADEAGEGDKLFVWSSDYIIGVDVIDADHKTIVDLINRIHRARRSKEMVTLIGSALNALREYAEFHFTREERMLNAAGFPDFVEHTKEHRTLLATLETLRNQFLRNPNFVSPDDLERFLKRWLSEHILLEDMAYKSFVVANEEAIDAARSLRFAEFLMASTDK